MFYEKGYAKYVESKTTKGGKPYTTFSLSVPNGKDSDGKAKYKYLHMSYWSATQAIKNDDYVEVTGEIDEMKNNDNKRELRLSVSMVRVLSRGSNANSKAEEKEDDDIPF